jgi:hypothetical protein
MAVVIKLTFAFKLLHLSLGLYYGYLDINAYYCSVSMKNSIKDIRDQLNCGK